MVKEGQPPQMDNNPEDEQSSRSGGALLSWTDMTDYPPESESNLPSNTGDTNPILGNSVTLGELEDTGGYYAIKKEEGDDIEGFSKKQRLVSQLASMLVPVAAIGVKGERFYSKLAQDHASYHEGSKQRAPLYALVLFTLFRDTDKPGFVASKPNILGGVAFDFDYAHFRKDDLTAYAQKLPGMIESLNSVDKGAISNMLESLEGFEITIQGEAGVTFIEGNQKNADYFLESAEEIQKVLLSRVGELRAILRGAIKE